MTTYKTHQEAKISNPESLICKFGDKFTSDASRFGQALQPCNPADHCMTVERFLSDGHRFQAGDLFIGTDGDVIDVEAGEHLEEMHRNQESDKYRYILHAAALEEKKPSTKIEYVKCEFESDYDHLKMMIDGEKFYTWDGEIEYSFNGARFIGKEKPNHNLSAEWTSPKPTELHRRIETPMTELDCFIQDCRKSTMVQDDVVAMSLFEAGCRFVN